jgi:hypothetical protein
MPSTLFDRSTGDVAPGPDFARGERAQKIPVKIVSPDIAGAGGDIRLPQHNIRNSISLTSQASRRIIYAFFRAVRAAAHQQQPHTLRSGRACRHDVSVPMVKHCSAGDDR